MLKKIIFFIGCFATMYSILAAKPPPRQLYFQSDNMVYWGTEFGLMRFQSENELWATIRPESINDMTLDDKTLWLGTDQGVLYADLRYLDWKGYTAKQGLPSDTVVRVVADLDFVYAAGPHGLARFNKLVEQWEPIGDFAGKTIYDLYSNQTQLWVATNAGVFYFDKKFEKWESYDAATGLISNTVYRLFYFNDYIWALTDNGFSRYSSTMKTWNSYKLNDGILGSAVNYFVADASYIWVVSPERISRFSAKNQAWENFSKNMPIEKSKVYSLSTSGTTSWFTTSDGVYSFDEDQRRWKTYTAVDGLSDDVQDQVYTSGQTTLTKKSNSFSYLRPTEDIWYANEIKISSGGKIKPVWKAHMDETGLGVTAPSGQSLNLLGRAYYKLKNKAEFPSPIAKNIGNYLTNKNLDSTAITTTTDSTGALITDTTLVSRYKDFLYGWAKAQMNLNADLNNGRTFRGTFDNTDPLGDKRYSAEYRGFGDDNVRRLGWRTDQKNDFFYSTLLAPTYLEGAGVRTEFGDRVGEKKIRRVNTGAWAGFGKTEFLRKLIPFREDNFYELGVQNIITESVEIKVDGKVIDQNDYSLERTMGLLTFKNEGLANPDSRIEVSCQYQPEIGVFTNQMAAAENIVAINDKVSIGLNGAYRGIKEPSRKGLGFDTNRTFAGSVNSKIEMKSSDSKLYLRAIPEISSSYDDSILVTKQGTGAKLGMYSVIHNLKLKGTAQYESPNYVTLADQNSVYGPQNHSAEGELVYDVWKQYMPVTIGASTTDAAYGSESRQYFQYLLSPANIPSIRLYGMHQSMKNVSREVGTTTPKDSLVTDRLNGIIETQWDLPDAMKTFLVDKLWINASYSVNLLTDSLYDTAATSSAVSFDQRLNQNIFAWLRWSPVKKLQLESKNIFRFFQDKDSMNGEFGYKGNRIRPEVKLFSQELIPGITLYGDYLFQSGEAIDTITSKATSTQHRLISSVLIVPGVYWSFLNPFQLNLGYNLSTNDSVFADNVGTSSYSETKELSTQSNSISFKPMLDFSEDLHFASRTELSGTNNFSLLTESGVKIYNESRLAFRDRKTRFDIDFNVFAMESHLPDYSTNLDTFLVKNNSYEFRIKWTERWFPNFRTELPIGLAWQNLDTTYLANVSSTGYINSITPGILFDWRIQGKIIREFRTQYYLGASLSNGKDFKMNTYEKAQENKLDIQVKAGSNFFIRLLLNVSYLIDEKILKYDMAELKATALF